MKRVSEVQVPQTVSKCPPIPPTPGIHFFDVKSGVPYFYELVTDSYETFHIY